MRPRHPGVDPRVYQSSVLAALLAWGQTGLGFDLPASSIAATLATALLTQWTFERLYHRPCFDPWSALISGLSLCLLLRTDGAATMAMAAVIAIASKFVLRVGDRHLWNPSNLAIAVMVLAGAGWTSPGQWGSAAWFALLAAGAGSVVVVRAARLDTSLAFLATWSGLLFGRALYLGDPLAIPLRQLQSGALLVFAFHMISDPKTTPTSRGGRIAFAASVATAGFVVHFLLYRQDGLLWSLSACAPLACLGGMLARRPATRGPGRLRRAAPLAACSISSSPSRPAVRPATPGLRHPDKETLMIRARILPPLFAVAALLALGAAPARAFCGFYVARAGSELFNRSSRVVLVRDADRTVLTMENDYQGDPSEFAMVVPVPTVLERDQIHVGDRATLDHLDAFTSPRLVEYFDPDPCRVAELEARAMSDAAPAAPRAAGKVGAGAALGVRIEARYSVGEYEILILSARESQGLETWLRRNGYQVPDGAAEVLRSYLKQGLYFFVAKVDLERHRELGFQRLRPLQMAYESPRFMLPIRLGMANAKGPQELFVFTLSRSGRVEPANYRTTRLPSDVDLPVFVKEEFPRFYRDLFSHHVEQERMRTVVLEHAWDMGWCDPCAADPLSAAELRGLGVFWVDPASGARPDDVFVTRLHLRYDRSGFPEDLVLRETGDRANFQGRYVLRHAWQGASGCPAARTYLAGLHQRWEREARNLAGVTGWDLVEIRDRMGLDRAPEPPSSWWQHLWHRDR